jgi:hypothetical protein
VAHLLQGGGQRVQRDLRQGVGGAVGFKQLQNRWLSQVGATRQVRQKADELGKAHHQLVLQPLAGGGTRLDQIPSGTRQRPQGLHALGGQRAGAGQTGQQPARQCLRI